MIKILIILFIYICILIFFKTIYVKFNNKKMEAIISDEEMIDTENKLKDSIDICKEILESMNNTNVKIVLDNNEKSSTSFYNVQNNSIVICDNEKTKNSFAKILTIAHECKHSIQDKKMLWTNFILANINILYFIITAILIIFNVITKENYLLFISILFILNMFSYLARIIIEADASYMSLIIARNYVKKYLSDDKVNSIMKKFEEIISGGFSTFAFGLFLNNVPMIFIYLIVIIIKLVI